MAIDSLEYARRGDVSYFRRAASEDIISSRDDEGDSVFSIAAKLNHFECCKEIFRTCPQLIYQSSNWRYTALHHAAYRGSTGMVEFLISAAAKTPIEDVEGGQIPVEKNLIRMLDNYGQSALDKTVIQQHYEAAKLLVAADPGFDHGVNQNNDKTTLMRAVQTSYGKTADSSAVKIRRLLLQNQPNSNHVQEALQNAIKEKELSTVLDIIQFYPGCLDLVNSEEQNILHLAAKYGHDQVLKAILKTKVRSASVLNAKDMNGYTPLHLAALGESTSCTAALYILPEVDSIPAVEDAVHEQEKQHGIRIGVNENELKNQSDFDLVVCALIATISFTSGIMVPGGYISDGPNSGMATLSKKPSFVIFIIANTFALLFSLYAVFSHFCTRHLRRKKDIELQVKVATLCTLGAIFGMVIAFTAGSYLVLAVSKGLAIAVLTICCTSILFALWPIVKMFMKRT